VLSAATPLPFRLTVCGACFPLSENMMLPLAAAVDCGLYCTLNVVEAFGAIVAGKTSPLMLKPLPERSAAVTDRLMFPVLLNVTF